MRNERSRNAGSRQDHLDNFIAGIPKGRLPMDLSSLARTDIPVYLAAMGPLLTRLAGEIGDGWISHELTSPSKRTRRPRWSS